MLGAVKPLLILSVGISYFSG